MFQEIVGAIIILMAIRTFLTRGKIEKLLYINVIGFGTAALVAFSVATPFGFVLATTIFLATTISLNAISYAFGRLGKEIILD